MGATMKVRRCKDCNTNFTGAHACQVFEAEMPKLVSERPEIGIKYDSNKPNMSLMSSIAINKLCLVLTAGEAKYSSHNWRKGIAWSRVVAGVLRHVFAYIGGERKDQETGLSHLAHAMCGLMFLLEYEDTKTNFDDLYKQD